ncbi:FAD-dependent oxidoreductase [Litorihabitans aurantiacus]|uniref:Oxidoreductase n=1 Tax=Litorihabitans aurantiacus TaxID=1930061 RepID=A0AA37UMP2_9MICO|nr:NAD(P)/FAD-dependent oxidoreductase [Litorihabitans aurantiacus]GMA31345.1 oxidoreductase [Litorihabitans aurantiacus]
MRDVLVVGGGAVGLALADRLLAAGLDVAVWERRDAPEAGDEGAGHSRAIGLHAPALEVLDPVLARTIASEAVHVRHGVARTRAGVLGVVPFDGVSRRFPYVATLPQSRTEHLLRAHVRRGHPGVVAFGTAVVAVEPTRSGVRVAGERRSRDGGSAAPVVETARFVVAADGARSAVRDLVGIEAPVHTYADTYLMGDVADSTGAGDDAVIHLEPGGVVESFPLPGGVRRWVVHTGPAAGPHLEASPELLAALVRERTGEAVDPATTSMLSAFAVRRRLAPRTVAGRVVLLGDAAHEISPIGGQGMNLGWLDGARLAPVLVAAVQGRTDAAGTARALAAYDVDRRRRARWAARQAELNMSLGRPVSGTRAVVRDSALTAALRTPLRRGLASVYAMRHMR